MKNCNSINCCNNHFIEVTNYGLSTMKFSITYEDINEKVVFEESTKFSPAQCRRLWFPCDTIKITVSIFLQNLSCFWEDIFRETYCYPCSMSFFLFGSKENYKVYKKCDKEEICVKYGSLGKRNCSSSCGNNVENTSCNKPCCYAGNLSSLNPCPCIKKICCESLKSCPCIKKICCESLKSCLCNNKPCYENPTPCSCNNRPSCENPTPCCCNNRPCCENPTPCCCNNRPCCENPTPCCCNNRPCCEIQKPCCCNRPCCENPTPCCCNNRPCCENPTPCFCNNKPSCENLAPSCCNNRPCCENPTPCFCNNRPSCESPSPSCCNNRPCCENPCPCTCNSTSWLSSCSCPCFTNICCLNNKKNLNGIYCCQDIDSDPEPNTESFIRLYNCALFVTCFSVEYDYKGQRLTQCSGKFSLGCSRQINLPQEARNLKLTFNIMDRTGDQSFCTLELFAVTEICFAVYGIAVDPYVYLVKHNDPCNS